MSLLKAHRLLIYILFFSRIGTTQFLDFFDPSNATHIFLCFTNDTISYIIPISGEALLLEFGEGDGWVTVIGK